MSCGSNTYTGPVPSWPAQDVHVDNQPFRLNIITVSNVMTSDQAVPALHQKPCVHVHVHLGLGGLGTRLRVHVYMRQARACAAGVKVKVKVHVIQARLGIDVQRQNQNKCNDKYMY